jgi:hypothetical protein
VVGEIKKRLSVSRRSTQMFDMDGFSLKKLNVKHKEYRFKIPNRFAALQNLVHAELGKLSESQPKRLLSY